MKLPAGLTRGCSRLAGQIQEEVFSEAGVASRAMAAGGRGSCLGPFVTRRQPKAEPGLHLGSLCAKDSRWESSAKAVGGLTMSETRSTDMQSHGGRPRPQ